MTRTLLALLFLLFVTGYPTAQAEPDPGEAATAFYAAYQQLNFTGLPNDEQLTTLTPYLSRRLVSQLQEAKLQQAIFIDQHPDEKPPLVEGDLFSSLFEGASSAKAGVVRRSGATARVAMHMQRSEDGTVVEWSDRYTLVRERGRWLLDDVEYRGDWAFASRGTLSGTLSGPL